MTFGSKTFFLLPVLLAAFFCDSECLAESGHESVTTRIKAATAPVHEEAIIDSVTPPTRNRVLAQVEYQGGPFWVESRQENIKRFKCSGCHTAKSPQIAAAAAMAHGVIRIEHGEQQGRLGCFTCHKEDERDYLITEEGRKVAFEHSYQLCGYCHFRQKKDWIGGAHGKRVANWAGKRVIRNCTSCHNPHSPKFAKRWPKTYSLPLD
jgi:formate-dependent nitrite reductase cytochrome c552 subunit